MLIRIIDEEGEVLAKGDRTENEVEIINKMIRDGVETAIKEKKPRTVTKATVKETLEIVDFYNVTCIGLIHAKVDKDKKTGKRKPSESKRKLVGAAIKRGVDFKELFIRASESDHLKGINKRGWKADFEWVLTPRNEERILEGRYDNHKPPDEKEKSASFNISDLEAAAMARYKR